MSSDATPDPYADPMTFGQRMQILRERRGMSRTVLGGLLGRSPEWVKQVEKGGIQAPGVDVVLRIAEALRVRQLAELTGRPSQVDLFAGPGHPRLAAVRSAVDALAPVQGGEAPTTAQLRARLARAWTARHSSSHHREVVGSLLPDLIRDAQLAVRQAERPADWRAAQSALSEVYSLCQFFVAYQPDAALLWRVAERGMVAAQQSDDPHAVGVSAWLLAQAHRDSGPKHFDPADTITYEALAHLDPMLPDGDVNLVAIAGALWFEAAYTAARRGETGTAWRHWDTARRVAARLPEHYYHPVTSFSRAVIGAHAVTVAVELRAGRESVRQAARTDAASIPSRPRRARHRIEEARAHQLNGQPEIAVATLAQAHEEAPETVRYNGYARRILLEETESRVASRRRRASELAVKVGLLAA
jgi:transcriptional regulator with XRE-family HTH domain